jgi:hypothetical protein
MYRLTQVGHSALKPHFTSGSAAGTADFRDREGFTIAENGKAFVIIENHSEKAPPTMIMKGF